MASVSKSGLKSIKSGVASRGLALTKLGLQSGARWALRGLSQVLESEDVRNARWKEFLVTQAQSFTHEVGQLKGSLMKAGQLLSMYGEHFLPVEVNQFLKTLQQDSPPLQWPVIRKILEKELGSERMAELEIEETSLASASMGQVHRARIKSSGEILALKVQYPGVDRAIESDLKALRMLLNMLQVLPKDFDLTPLFAELKTMLEQEVDYKQEAEWTRLYGERLRSDARYSVPLVFEKYSSLFKCVCLLYNLPKNSPQIIKNIFPLKWN